MEKNVISYDKPSIKKIILSPDIIATSVGYIEYDKDGWAEHVDSGDKGV